VSISCDHVLIPDYMYLAVFVAWYRNGRKVAAASNNNSGSYG
jgi:hypothetical protein